MSQLDRQAEHHDRVYGGGSRSHVTTSDPLIRYLTRWRLAEGMARMTRHASQRLTMDSPILVMCAGEGLEGTVLADMGYSNVTVSDISSAGVAAAKARDERLEGLVLNAEQTGLEAGAFDVVVVQDGLHHLTSPVAGFTEMMRIASVGAMFLEPHDSWVGRRIGTKWEVNGDAINYVFRWTTKLVNDIANSYLGRDAFANHSFAFWHHNIAYERLGRKLGGGPGAIRTIKGLKGLLDAALSRYGNQFCGLIVKR